MLSQFSSPGRKHVSQGFTKYRERGAYHWRELSKHPLHVWPYTRSRVEWVVRQYASSASVLEIGCSDGKRRRG